MKRSVLFLTLISALLAGLVGCGCSHEWAPATCTTPATCTKCGQTEGEPLGHTWTAATCTTPETCAVCGATTGTVLAHQWESATCTAPETCAVCGETQGEPLGHSLDSVGRCDRCGEAIGTALTLENYTQFLDLRFDAGAAPGLDQYAGGPADTYYRPYVACYMNGGGKRGYKFYNVRVKAECKLVGTAAPEIPSVMKLTGGVSEKGRLESLEPGFLAPGVMHYIKSKEGRYNSASEALRALGTVNYDCAVTEISGYVIPE